MCQSSMVRGEAGIEFPDAWGPAALTCAASAGMMKLDWALHSQCAEEEPQLRTQPSSFVILPAEELQASVSIG